MNREQVYNKFCETAESNNHYFNFERRGIIEEILAFFNLTSEPFLGASSVVHEKNLLKLHDFLLNNATDEQVDIVKKIALENKKVPSVDFNQPSVGKVFVSMPMNRDKCPDVDTIRAGIKAGIEASNNKPYFLDQDVFNGNITSKMLEEIAACKFLIADFTTQNAGVYYEAGYAKALGKTVIHTCKKDDFNTLHFDIKQYQTVRWDNEEDLKNELYNQILKSGLGGNQ